MIVIGLGVLTLGFSRRRRHRLRLQPLGPRRLLPQGHRLARLMTLQGVMFAYLAVELVGVTAGESEDPEKTLPKAINTAALAHRALLRRRAHRHPVAWSKWTEFAAGRQPLRAGLREDRASRLGAGIVNFVVLTAALSSCNSGMYSTGRMLRDLADNGEAPKVFSKLSSTKTPRLRHHRLRAASWASASILNYVVPEKAFGYVTSVATAAGIWTWMMILVSHILLPPRGRRRPPARLHFPGAGRLGVQLDRHRLPALRHRPHRVRRRTPASACT